MVVVANLTSFIRKFKKSSTLETLLLFKAKHAGNRCEANPIGSGASG